MDPSQPQESWWVQMSSAASLLSPLHPGFGRQRPFPSGGDPESPLSPSPCRQLPGCPSTHLHPSWEPTHHQYQPSCPSSLQGAALWGLGGMGCSLLPLKNEPVPALAAPEGGPFSSHPTTPTPEPPHPPARGSPTRAGVPLPPSRHPDPRGGNHCSPLLAAKAGTLGRAWEGPGRIWPPLLGCRMLFHQLAEPQPAGARLAAGQLTGR